MGRHEPADERELRAWLAAIAILAGEAEQAARVFTPDASGVRCRVCRRRWADHLFTFDAERCPREGTVALHILT